MYGCTYTTMSTYVDVTTLMVILRESVYRNMWISIQPYIHELREYTVFGTYSCVAVTLLRPPRKLPPLDWKIYSKKNVNDNISHWIFGNKFQQIFTHREDLRFSLVRKLENFSHSSTCSSSIYSGISNHTKWIENCK